MRAAFFLTFVLSSALALADTVTLRTGAEINGDLSYDGKQFLLTANFRDGKQQKYEIKRQDIRIIQFNDVTSNNGTPETWFSMHSGEGTKEVPPFNASKSGVYVTSDKRNTTVGQVELTGKKSDGNADATQKGEKRKKSEETMAEVTKSVREGKDVLLIRGDGERIGTLTKISKDAVDFTSDKQKERYKRIDVRQVILGW